MPTFTERAMHDKVVDLDVLAQSLDTAREAGRRIVHCHGTFDSLQITQIRELVRAKELGDVLLVTLPADARTASDGQAPTHSDATRAEAIAALEVVDYVAIDSRPTPDVIRLLRPDVYVRSLGADADTATLRFEEEAVRAIGGTVRYIQFAPPAPAPGQTVPSPAQGPSLPAATREFLAAFRGRHSLRGVLDHLDRARGVKTLLIGETIIDEYVYCEAIGKSSKEPTLVVKQLSSELFAGGILAVANHMANFCDQVAVVTTLGTRNSHEALIEKRLNPRIERVFLRRADSPTIRKTRYIDQYFFQKLFEVYDINDDPSSETDVRTLCDTLRGRIAEYDLVVVFDFGHGMLTQEAVDLICREARFLVVNTQSNAGNLGYHSVSKYSRADLFCLTEAEARLEARDRRGDVRPIVEGLARRLHSRRAIVTRGSRGCLCYEQGTGFAEVPAVASRVVDRVGAGDGFLSLAALLTYQGAPLEVVGLVGNVAGAQAAGTVGHRTSIERNAVHGHLTELLR